MSKWSNDEEYQKLSKEQLIELLRTYGRIATALDGLWFLTLEGVMGTEKTINLMERVWAQYGRVKGNILKKFLSIDGAATLEQICKAYLLTPIFSNLGGRAEIRNGKCYLSATNCHPQKARVRKGLGEFPCKGVGKEFFGGFLAALNPDAKFNCVVCPPDAHSEDLWCEWEVWLK